MTTMKDMGEGPIQSNELAPTLRVVRHNVIQLQAAQGLQNDLLKDSIARTAVAVTAAERNTGRVDRMEDRIKGLQDDIYGRADRPGDIGMMGELKADIASMRKQQWAILVAMLGVMLTGIIDIVARLQH